MKGDLFLFIFSELNNKVRELQKIDLNRGQLNQTDNDDMFPCVLIDFGETTYTDEGQGLQYGDCKLILNVVQKSNDLSSLNALTNEKISNLLSFPNKIYRVLQDKSDLQTSFQFTRSKEDAIRIEKEYLIYPIEFSVTLHDVTKRTEDISNLLEFPNSEIDII